MNQGRGNMEGRRYFLAKPDPEVEEYLGFWGRIEHRAGQAYVVSSPADYVDWQRGRLASGMLLWSDEVFNTLDAALACAQER